MLGKSNQWTMLRFRYGDSTLRSFISFPLDAERFEAARYALFLTFFWGIFRIILEHEEFYEFQGLLSIRVLQVQPTNRQSVVELLCSLTILNFLFSFGLFHFSNGYLLQKIRPQHFLNVNMRTYVEFWLKQLSKKTQSIGVSNRIQRG